MKSLSSDLKFSIALFLPYSSLIRLKRVNREFRNLCSSHWFWLSKASIDCKVPLEQITELYNKPSILYTLNGEQKYIRTLAYHDKVVQGSEKFLVLKICIDLSIRVKDYPLFCYFHSKTTFNHNTLLATYTDDIDFLVTHLQQSCPLGYWMNHVTNFYLYKAGRLDVLPDDYTAYQAIIDFIATGDQDSVNEYSPNLIIKILIALDQDSLVDKVAQRIDPEVIVSYKLQRAICKENLPEYLALYAQYLPQIWLDRSVKEIIGNCQNLEIINHYLSIIDNLNPMRQNENYQSLYEIAAKDTSYPLFRILIKRAHIMLSYNMELLLEYLPAIHIYLSNDQKLEDLNLRDPHSYFIDYNPENVDFLLSKTDISFRTKLLKWKEKVDRKKQETKMEVAYDSQGHQPL